MSSCSVEIISVMETCIQPAQTRGRSAKGVDESDYDISHPPLNKFHICQLLSYEIGLVRVQDVRWDATNSVPEDDAVFGELPLQPSIGQLCGLHKERSD
eukprot:766294-Hanusia_phi.AAC.3